jgi:hypothetical protein
MIKCRKPNDAGVLHLAAEGVALSARTLLLRFYIVSCC